MSGEEQKQRHGEDEQQRRNREVIELLNELRVALPGVQVLFAFLLIVPFSQGFSSVTPQQRYVYFATLLCTGFLRRCSSRLPPSTASCGASTPGRRGSRQPTA